jgi:hypothetical protein
MLDTNSRVYDAIFPDKTNLSVSRQLRRSYAFNLRRQQRGC